MLMLDVILILCALLQFKINTFIILRHINNTKKHTEFIKADVSRDDKARFCVDILL